MFKYGSMYSMVHLYNKKDACFGLSWTLCTIFKICSQFSKIAIFEKIVKPRFFNNVNFLSVFQCGAPSFSHGHDELVEHLVNEIKFLKNSVVKFFAPNNHTSINSNK